MNGRVGGLGSGRNASCEQVGEGMLRDPMPRALRIAGLVFAVALAALWARRAVLAYAIEAAELRAEVPEPRVPEGDAAIAGLRELEWTLASGAVQHGWYVPSRNGALVVFAHGSPGDCSSLLPEARSLIARGFGALLVDFPGYGASQGERTWGASYRESLGRALDIAAAQPEVDPERIGGFGFSMGSSVLAQVAAERLGAAKQRGTDRRARYAALILRGAFPTLEEQLQAQFASRFPGAAWLAVLSARLHGVAVDELDTQAAVRMLHGQPLLVLVGQNDTATPPPMAQRVAREGGASWWVMDGTGHVGIPRALQNEYETRIARFFERYLTKQ